MAMTDQNTDIPSHDFWDAEHQALDELEDIDPNDEIKELLEQDHEEFQERLYDTARVRPSLDL